MKSSPLPARAPPSVAGVLQRALVRWFESEQRDLPWRRTRDPYAIWISEAMLQQTRVEVVRHYFERFVERFPDVRALAAADESEVLALWSGLGYYSRARSLRAAARVVLERHAGELPRTRAAWLELPGVGPYTAGAVLSIAFGLAEPLVDGNVQRVFARLFALEAAAGSRALAESSWNLARALVPAPDSGTDPGQWNQALMELGARVCTPQTPRCEACPLRAICAARAAGRQGELPPARARPAPIAVRLEILVPFVDEKLVVLRRPSAGRMAGLWEFPTRELVAAGESERLWPRAHALSLRAERGARALLGELAHTITRHRIRAEVRRARLGASLPPAGRLTSPEELEGLALTGLARKVLELVRARPR